MSKKKKKCRKAKSETQNQISLLTALINLIIALINIIAIVKSD